MWCVAVYPGLRFASPRAIIFEPFGLGQGSARVRSRFASRICRRVAGRWEHHVNGDVRPGPNGAGYDTTAGERFIKKSETMPGPALQPAKPSRPKKKAEAEKP